MNKSFAVMLVVFSFLIVLQPVYGECRAFLLCLVGLNMLSLSLGYVAPRHDLSLFWRGCSLVFSIGALFLILVDR